MEQLRQIVGALQIADVAAQVALNLRTDFADFHDFKPGDHQHKTLTTALDQLVTWSTALDTLRPASSSAAA
ncbi:hypothetical protein OG905_18985 [Streptomyces sp. NBC_00322]|uniref:hypothetical protein n=1 Tax=Streptomyces sp. NBC_00322 TaxID=2975712 RepID=UPI002E29D196|nr:hypothetical protein [Streptomyces sp. NBC_00322]